MTAVPVRSIYRGRVVHLTVESITLPNGHPLDLEIVRHPGSVVLIPITDAGEIIRVRQYRHAIGRSALELPAGSLKPEEDPRAAAIRECHEEIGLIPGDVSRVGAFFPTPGYCDEEMFFFRVSGLSVPAHEAEQDEDEDIEVQTFTLKQAREMVRRGEIVDMKTVIGLTLI